MPNEALAELERNLELALTRRKFWRKDFFKPYPKQREFITLGATKRERLLMAGNQNGKSEVGAYETACHLTGLYPPDWQGRRWDRPLRAWADGETSLLVRDVQQRKLCGPPGVDNEFGTGMIPRDCFAGKPSLARGVTDAYDTIQVKHFRTDGTCDGTSTLTFKSYEQGRQKHQGEPIDFDWCDEEPPEDVYSEILTRVTATQGMVFTTFTPLKGMSNVVMKFLNEPSEDRAVVTMTIYDAEHIPAEERDKIIAGWPAHEREARAKGIPMLGSGRIFQVAEEAIIEPPIEHVPLHWWKLWAIDFGIDHPFAAVLLLWDKDNDVIHVHHALKMPDAIPVVHAVPMKAVASSVPVAWPQDGTKRDWGDGKQVALKYKAAGLAMLPTHATWPDGSVSTEAAVLEMQERMATGRLKVANHLSEWLGEFRLYHRKDGVIQKINDDLLSATQKGIMAKRYARQVALGGGAFQRRRQLMAEGHDFDPFTGQ